MDQKNMSGNNSPAGCSSIKKHLQNLNPAQLEAVQHYLGPILVLAGAGSGKTRILTRRIANLVLDHKVNPREILAVTFTNKATQEMKDRLGDLLGGDASGLWVSTFHSAALRILRVHAEKINYQAGFAVYDQDDSKKLMGEVLKQLGLDEENKKQARQMIGKFLRRIDQAKNNYLFPHDLSKDAKSHKAREVAQVYEHYQRALLQANAMDFGDLLMNVITLFKENPKILNFYQDRFKFILIDEYQDTNNVQYQFVRMLSAKHKNLLVVGDDDQSIYAFRGATIRNILEFEQDFPNAKVVKLEQNYRSTGNVLELAHSVISKNLSRKAKKLWTEQGGGDPIYTFVAEDEQDEADFVARTINTLTSDCNLNQDSELASSCRDLRDVAIFYRTNAQSRAIEEALLERGIEYRIYGGLKFYDRMEVKDIIAYLRLIFNPNDNQAFLRVVNTPARGIGPRTVEGLRQKVLETGRSFYQEACLLGHDASVSGKVASGKAVSRFVELIEGLKKSSNNLSLSALTHNIIEQSGYLEMLKKSKDEASLSRMENLKELESIARSMEDVDLSLNETIQSFLDRVSLSSSDELPKEEHIQTDKNDKPDAVSLMTLHLAKGLEFPFVFLVGFEEGLLPHSRSIGTQKTQEFDPDALTKNEPEDEGLAEERRLCYVGITRAMEKLYISWATHRGMFASSGAGYMYREVSRFAYDFPRELLSSLGGSFYSGSAYSDDSMEIDPDLVNCSTFQSSVFQSMDDESGEDESGEDKSGNDGSASDGQKDHYCFEKRESVSSNTAEPKSRKLKASSDISIDTRSDWLKSADEL